MKGAVLHDARDIRIEEVSIPAVGPTDVLLRVAYVGICGSDLHVFARGPSHPGQPSSGPRIIGHEVAGLVVEVGSDVTTCQPGDRVTCIPWAACGVCSYCRRGIVNHCVNKRRLSGSFAEFAVVPEPAVFRIPDDMPLRRAVLAEPLSCCVWAMDLAGLQSGETAVIVGAGAIGLLLQMLARRGGAFQTIVSEPKRPRRELATELGATMAVDPRETSLLDVVRSMTDGIGADVAFEAVGHPSTVQDALSVVRNAGTIVVVGLADPSATLPCSPFDLYRRELTVRGCFTRRLSFDRALNWLRDPAFDRVITHEFPLDDVVSALEVARTGAGAKVLIAPYPEANHGIASDGQ